MPYGENDIDGWVFDQELDWLYEKSQEMESIVEIGSYKGKSTHALLSGCPGTVYAVDDFRGIPHDSCPLKGKKLEAAFDKNMKGFPNLVKMKTTSEDAAKLISTADMVFIDASHDYESVRSDISIWMPKTKKLLCGHDYKNDDWPEVTKAVDAAIKPDRIQVIGNIWYVEMPR